MNDHGLEKNSWIYSILLRRSVADPPRTKVDRTHATEIERMIAPGWIHGARSSHGSISDRTCGDANLLHALSLSRPRQPNRLRRVLIGKEARIHPSIHPCVLKGTRLSILPRSLRFIRASRPGPNRGGPAPGYICTWTTRRSSEHATDISSSFFKQVEMKKEGSMYEKY
jgi:hypothetical protein